MPTFPEQLRKRCRGPLSDAEDAPVGVLACTKVPGRQRAELACDVSLARSSFVTALAPGPNGGPGCHTCASSVGACTSTSSEAVGSAFIHLGKSVCGFWGREEPAGKEEPARREEPVSSASPGFTLFSHSS